MESLESPGSLRGVAGVGSHQPGEHGLVHRRPGYARASSSWVTGSDPDFVGDRCADSAGSALHGMRTCLCHTHIAPPVGGRLSPVTRLPRGWVAGIVYRQRMVRMPEPGDLIEAFTPLPDRCFRMIQSRQLQAMEARDHAPRLTTPTSESL